MVEKSVSGGFVRALETLNKYLVSSELTVVRFFGPVLEIKFECPANNSGPGELYLFTSEVVFVLPKETQAKPPLPGEGEPFNKLRVKTFGHLHYLFAQKVESVEVDRGGILEVHFRKKKIIVIPEKDEWVEEFWAVSSSPPSHFDQPEFKVFLDASFNLITTTPDL